MADQSTNKLAKALGVVYRQAHRLRKQSKAKDTRPKPGRRARVPDSRQLDIEDILARTPVTAD